MQSNRYELPTGLHRFFWWVLPEKLGRVSHKLLVSVTDGYFIAATRAGAFLSPLVLAIGIAWGWWHFGFDALYTQNFWFVLLAVILGSASNHLGLLFTLGFIIGDLFFSNAHYGDNEGILRNLSLLVSYIVLALITVVPAILIKYLVAEIKLPASVGFVVRMIVAGILYGALTYFYISFWVNMNPVLIRPVFIWHGVNPDLAAFKPVADQSGWFIWAGVVVAVLRVAVQSIMASKPGNQSFYETIENHYVNISRRRTYSSYLNPWVRTLLIACITSFTIAGMFSGWLTAIITTVLVFFFHGLSAGLIRKPNWVNTWAKHVYKVPAIFRLAIGFILIYLISLFVVSLYWPTRSEATPLTPLLIPTLLAFLILFLVNPGKPEKTPSYETPQ